MTTERIKQIQAITGLPDSVSVQQALLQVWNECEQEKMVYAKAKFEEGASQQRTLANEHCMKFHKHVLLELPKPEFKP